MAITPEAAGRFSQQELNEIAEIEKRIDRKIKKDYTPGSGSRVHFSAFDVSMRFQKEIIRRYEASGWNVKIVPCNGGRDQCFEFEKK